MDVVHCNREQAEKILKTYFSHKPLITRVSKDSEDGIYFITAQTVPGGLHNSWQWRGYACFGEVHKGDRRYDLNDSYPKELMKPLNDACYKAVEDYEKGNDIFSDDIFAVEKEEVETPSLWNVIFALILGILLGFIIIWLFF